LTSPVEENHLLGPEHGTRQGVQRHLLPGPRSQVVLGTFLKTHFSCRKGGDGPTRAHLEGRQVIRKIKDADFKITDEERRREDTSCRPVGLVSRTGLPMQTPADFIELRLSWTKVDLQLLGVLSSAVGEIYKNNCRVKM